MSSSILTVPSENPRFVDKYFSLPQNNIQTLGPIAMAVWPPALTEAASIARSMALRTGQRIDANQQFIGQGLSHIAGAFFSGYASSGSFNRSACLLGG